jgi:transposase-like protein
MEDFPQDLLELEDRFSTEAACRDYLVQLRWPGGFRCPRCGYARAWPVRTVWLECAGCHHQTSVTAGTVFQDTRKPLRQWFRAIWFVTSQKNGASALGLQRILGLKTYVTAWSWLHRLRRAMVRPGRDRLKGVVEVDETYLGGLEEGVVGRQAVEKAVIAVAAEEDGDGIGRIRLQHIPDASACSLHTFVLACVDAGSVVHTDGWDGYSGIEEFGYKRKVTVLAGKKRKPHVLMPRVHRVASLLKRWILGTHQGAISHEHLEYYLDEFTFRFNRRTSQSRGKLFFRLLQQALQTAPVPGSELKKGVRAGPERRPRRRRAPVAGT